MDNNLLIITKEYKMDSKIIMLRLIGGEFLIGQKDNTSIVDENSMVAEDSNKIKLKDVRVFSVQMTGRGAAIAFLPLFPFTEKPIPELGNAEIDKSVILQVIEEKYIDGEILNGYRSNITGLDLSAAKKGIII